MGFNFMELPPEINKLVNEIANDRLSGASAIARNTVECLDAYAGWVMENENITSTSPELFLQNIIELGQDLVRSQPTMAAVLNAVNFTISSTRSEYEQLGGEIAGDPEKQLKYLCILTQSSARKYIVESKLALKTIAGFYKKLIHDGDMIMTISASSAVEELFSEAYHDSVDFTVYVPEARPMYEGRLMAERLARMDQKTVLIADSAMFHFLKKCNVIIVGADRVTPNGIMNKIGTYGLAIAAKELKIPFYCVCELTKFIPDLTPIKKLIRDYPEEQIYCMCGDDIKPEKLSVRNIYFDFTPMKYVAGVLTDGGMMKKKAIVNYIKGIEIMPELLK